MTVSEDSGDGRGVVLKRDRVAHRPEPVPVPVGELPPGPPHGRGGPSADGGEPEVQVRRGPDGAIQSITVTCSCGREMTLQCEYFEEGEEDAVEDS
jgi:hypothetical protein